jgi:hypothetical protein
MKQGERPPAGAQCEEQRPHSWASERLSPKGRVTDGHESNTEPMGTPIGLALLICLVGSLYLPLISWTAVAGDEFRFLSDIHSVIRGDLIMPVQSLHVHLFRWLPAVGRNEVDQVIVGRIVYSLLLLASCAFVFIIARRFLSRTASIFVILCFLAFREVILTANSFRYDGLSVFFLLASLAIMLRSNRQAALVASGGLFAVALLVTVKSVFYLPTLVAVAVLTRSSIPWTRRLGDLALFAGACSAVFLALFAFMHYSHGPDSAGDTATRIQNAGLRVFIFNPVFPARSTLLNALIANAFVWLFLAFGTVSLFKRLRNGHERREAAILLSLLLPLGSLVFYRNAFAYYYIFVMPAALVVAGVRFDEVFRRALGGRAKVAVPFLILMIGSLILTFAVNYRSVLHSYIVSQGYINEGQRRTIEAVHRIFPDPVPYIDAKSMISSFPKVGFFMSSWHFENYHDAGVPIFRSLLQDKQPRFLLANHDALLVDDADESAAHSLPVRRSLLPEDRRTLRENFVHHWGEIFVAGKRIAMSPGARQEIEIMIGGPYTVEFDSPVIIDGVLYDHGSVIQLPPGNYMVEADQSGVLVLRWGRHLYRPIDTPPTWERIRPAEALDRRGQFD